MRELALLVWLVIDLGFLAKPSTPKVAASTLTQCTFQCSWSNPPNYELKP